MQKYAVMAAAVAATLLGPLVLHSAVAMPTASPRPIASLVHKTQVFCGQYGCGRIHYGPHHRRWRWDRWGYHYRPACPTGYYYACRTGPLGYGQCACRTGPLGYGQCACWPYRPY